VVFKFDIWVAFGLVAQIMFSARFLIQWIASEIRKESFIPKSFWYLSLLGSSMLLIYAIHRRDPVFILGQSFGTIVYIRNIALYKGNKDKEGETKAQKDGA